MSDMYVFTRAAYSKVSRPVARGALKLGFTPDAITVLGTTGLVASALVLFPMGELFIGALVVTFFVLADMLDGAMARERGYGSRFGIVLDASCDRISDGAVFTGLAWWAMFVLDSRQLLVATLICLVSSQVISYVKARAEASGLRGDGGWIERPERLIIVLAAAFFSDLPGHPAPMVLIVAMWVLAGLSVITVAQRIWSVRGSEGALDPMPVASAANPDGPVQDGPGTR
ncbi:phosphatidylinositol phosphate synthase [Mycolicibacterium fallax]|uniref:Phosphatidylinositol phosphate synthase n=1 Tax=Mycolicibacterium fallax TaxID=1793 RepID=A0A1X1RGF0_MYCFA|nr:CDP-alcohol phosphatidyltransferase family protein [Mycolicibacterium fallax]ORV05443.1 CDP-diacylglycerol--inositol 3-phosphatidyltransferase [Mycolicibacterium fallax]BBY97041.1 CDP-diacylglycerol--inositol 3-phosphatidyltransferase [Mycolicibacterium fallax]HOW93609.1 CDP-alcohol phosphatidyltransferase family protein [Mycolicibacterium fallax]HSA40910.1 CDP-alcohol phosphatidyltransferase family protein [Mycobacterium sp.]